MPVPLAAASDLTLAHRPYAPRGAALALIRYGGPEVVLAGPAGTGKSRACLEKLHLLAEQVPGLRGLILRRTRESLTEAALVTWEQHVLPENHPALEGPRRNFRQVYRYPNGSELVVGGLDKPGKIMSTEYDVAYIQEAIELPEDGWEAVTTRLRNGRLGYQQLFADTNPDRPTHWLKRRCDAGRCLLLESRHEDNPRLWTAAGWTAEGADYITKLDALTGPRKHRLRHGRWVQAEGVVYDGWDSARHLVDRAAVPDTWPRYWSVDFGYTNPFVWQAWALDPDGRLVRYREVYHTGRLVEDHARRILELTRGEPRPRAIVCDHDAEDRATLERHLGLKTVAAHKTVSDGIQAVASRLKCAGDGKPRLVLMRDSLDARDPRRDEGKRPACTEEEVDGYVWNIDGGRRKGEEPVKDDDHGMDALRYMVAHLDLVPKREFKVWGGSDPAPPR